MSCSFSGIAFHTFILLHCLISVFYVQFWCGKNMTMMKSATNNEVERVLYTSRVCLVTTLGLLHVCYIVQQQTCRDDRDRSGVVTARRRI